MHGSAGSKATSATSMGMVQCPARSLSPLFVNGPAVGPAHAPCDESWLFVIAGAGDRSGVASGGDSA